MSVTAPIAPSAARIGQRVAQDLLDLMEGVSTMVVATVDGIDVASALNIAAFNLGIAAGAWIGGLVVASPLGLGATPWVGAILVAGALGLTLISGALDRRERSQPDAAACQPV